MSASAITAALKPHLGFEPESLALSSAPCGEQSKITLSPAGDVVEVAYLAADPWPAKSFWPEDGSRGELRRFRSTVARDRHLTRLANQDLVAFDVVAPARGELKAAPIGSMVDPIGVYAPAEGRSEALRDGDATMAGLLKEADAMLQAFLSWRRGDVFTVVRDRFKIDHDAGTVAFIDTSRSFGHCGEAEARRAIEATGRPQERSLPRP